MLTGIAMGGGTFPFLRYLPVEGRYLTGVAAEGLWMRDAIRRVLR